MIPHTRSASILRIYRLYNRPLMDREVMEEMGSKDPNLVRPRITEMLKADPPLLVKVGTTESGITHKHVRLVTAARPRETKDMFKELS